jgi:hypothetical protein
LQIGQEYRQGFGIGTFFASVMVNQSSTPTVYFGNISTGDTVIPDGNNIALDLCGVYDSTSANRVSPSLPGSYDVLNFIFYEGFPRIFVNDESKSNYYFTKIASPFLFCSLQKVMIVLLKCCCRRINGLA